VVGFFFLLLQISLFDLWSFPNDTEKQNSLEIRLHQKFHSVHTKMNISSAAWQSVRRCFEGANVPKWGGQVPN
jgi:hypothetical protein